MTNWQQFLLMVHLLALLTGLLYIHHDAIIRRRSGFWSVVPVVFLSWFWILLWFAIRPPKGGHQVSRPIATAPRLRTAPAAVPPSRPQPVNHGRVLFGALNELQWQLRLGKISQESFDLEKSKLLDALAGRNVEQSQVDFLRELTVLTDSGCVSTEDIQRIKTICEKTPPPNVSPAKPAPQEPVKSPPAPANLKPAPVSPAPLQSSLPKPSAEPQQQDPAPVQQASPPRQQAAYQPQAQQPARQPQPQTPAQPSESANSPDFYRNWSTQLLVREFLRTKDPIMGKALGSRGLPGELEPLVRELGATRLIDLYNETKSPELAEELRRRRLDRFL